MYRLSLILFLLLSVSAYGQTIIFDDTFTEGSVTALESHAPDTGTSWSNPINTGSATGFFVSSSIDRAVADVDALGKSVHTTNPSPSTDKYDVDMDVTFGSEIGTVDWTGMVVNYIDINNYYACGKLDDTATGLYIVESNGGSISTLDSVTTGSPMSSGDNLKCEIDYSGSDPVIKLYINDSEVLSATDTATKLTKTGAVGIACGSIFASDGRCETGFTMDNFTVNEFATGRRILITESMK